MKRIILSLLFATAAFGQISVQKKQDGSNQISNGPVVVGSNNSITATGTGVIAATAIPSISIITTAPLTGGAALTGNLTLAIPQSSGSVNGYLSSGDWTIFNTKQPAGNYITALTGDGSAAGPGSAVFTLTTVLGSPGSVGTSTNAPVVTFDAKGRATATSTVTITPALGSITGLGTGIAAFLATPSSANLAAAITDETGTGALVFGTSPTLVSPHFGSIANTGTLTLPTVTDTLIGRATTDVLTNKSISGSTNTLTNIPNSALTNQGITLGTTVVNLGGTVTSLAGINSITAASATDLVLNGGSLGASLTLGQGANGALTFTAAGTGGYLFNGAPADMLGTGRSNNLSVFNAAAGTIQLGSSSTIADVAQGTLFFGTTGASSNKQGAAIQARNSGTITTQAAAYLQIYTNAGSGLAEVARFTSNLLIGTTTDISGSGGLSVAGAGFVGGNLTVSGTGTSSFAGTITTGVTGSTFMCEPTTSAGGAVLLLRKGSSIGMGAVDSVGLDGLNIAQGALVPFGIRGSIIKLLGPAAVTDTTISTSTTTGSLVNAGGFGNAGAGFFGGNLTVSGTGGITSTGAATFLATSNFGGAATAWVGTNGSSGLALNFPTGGRIDIDVNNTGVASCTATLFKTESGVNGQIGGNLTVNGTTGIAIGTAGATLSVKSGTNAASGTVTLAAGTATITSTAIDANTVIIFSEKTAGGTPGVYQPLAAVSAGSATVTSAATDTSTYNWVALKVAP